MISGDKNKELEYFIMFHSTQHPFFENKHKKEIKNISKKDKKVNQNSGKLFQEVGVYESFIVLLNAPQWSIV